MKKQQSLLIGVLGQLLCLPSLACTVSATGLQFGQINPIAGISYNSEASINVMCPSLAEFSVSLSPGAGSYTQRTMTAGADVLNYNIFLNSDMTLLWGDGTSGTVTWNGSANTTGTTQTLYGHVPYQPTVYPAIYADSILVTVSF